MKDFPSTEGMSTPEDFRWRSSFMPSSMKRAIWFSEIIFVREVRQPPPSSPPTVGGRREQTRLAVVRGDSSR